jgi:hypothetical protein
MTIPDEFVGRVYKTRFSGWASWHPKLDEIQKLAEGSGVDVIYEEGRAIVVLVFETQEDCTAFTLKYGDRYA